MRRFVCTVTRDSPREQPLPPGAGTTDNWWRLSITIRRLRRHSGTNRLVFYADRTGSRPTTAGKAPGDAKGAPFPSATRTGALFQRKSATEHGFYFGHGYFTLVATTTLFMGAWAETRLCIKSSARIAAHDMLKRSGPTGPRRMRCVYMCVCVCVCAVSA